MLGQERKIGPDALQQMRQHGGQWAVYENHDLGHCDLGHLQFLKFGPGCTFETPPERMPDTETHINWRYCPGRQGQPRIRRNQGVAMNTRREPYSPAQAAQKIRGLRLAAERFEREEFERIVNPAPVQLQFSFDNPAPAIGSLDRKDQDRNPHV